VTHLAHEDDHPAAGHPAPRVAGEVDADVDVDLDVRVEAPPEEVFDYVTDPARFPGVDGAVTLGEIIAQDAPCRVRWHAGTRDGDGATADAVVEVTLTPDGGGTRVRVVQRPLGGPIRARIAASRRPERRCGAARARCRAAARLNLLARAR
jgi:uncharacterized protein YndB with AHSA1/START domain